MSPQTRREPPPWLPPLADALAEALPRLYGQPADPPLQELLVALTRALERGELAIDLEGPAPEGLHSPGWPEVHRRALERSPLAEDPHGPLALEGQLVGWRRWRHLRGRVLAALIERARRQRPASDWIPPAALGDPHQQRAIRTALERDLLVLAGGPGTGKTSTVAHLLAAVAERRDGAVIQLAAPTGKAAARLRLATGGRWPCGTLHQLLESRGEGDFRRHRQRPLNLDLLVVDEVSMVDLALMEALLAALPEEAGLVLVGDPAQLPPVAPGAPLRDLMAGEPALALAPATVTLRTVYRNDGAIATVAAALRERLEAEGDDRFDPISVLRPLLGGLAPDANLRWHEAPAGPLPPPVRRHLLDHLERLGVAARPCAPGREEGWRELVAIRDQLLLLTPRHRGPWGVEAVHRELLGEATVTALAQWPSGTPVLCRRNLPSLGLSNGDLGVLVANGERWLLFGQEAPIWVHPAQVSGALEPALALTVHKAQGSEAQRVIVLLPGTDPTDPRLLYTALTRARQEAWLWTAPAGDA
jgi:exodeoxyribonuclease V alpha subunit